MKIGFSSLICPDWDLDKIVASASTMGFDGVELCGLRGECRLPLVPELARDPGQVRQKFADSKVELVCLGAPAALSSTRRREVADQQASIVEHIELAAKLGCPQVRIRSGDLDRVDHRRAALSRIAEALASLAPIASQFNVTLVVENGGDFPSSQDLWFMIDAVAHPAVQACWSQCNALIVRERATLSIPRLGSRIGLLHLCDARLDARGIALEYKTPGEGDTQIARQIELLKGLTYDRYLMFAPAPAMSGSRPNAEQVLPGVAEYLRGCVETEQTVLSAYKNDKYAPRLAARPSVAAHA